MNEGQRVGRVVDALQYAIGLTVLAGGALLPISVLVGAGLSGVKYGLFLIGVLTMGYATLLAWPRSPSDLESEGVNREETRFQAVVRRFPPATWYPLAPDDRYLDWTKLYLATLFLWGGSFALETLIGA
jgi:hypothetical protein